MKKPLLTTLFLCVLAAVPAGASEDRGGPGRPPPGGMGGGYGFNEREWSGITLSSSQKERLLDAMTRHFRASQEVVLARMDANRERGDGDRERSRERNDGERGRERGPGGPNRPSDQYSEKMEELRRQLRSEIESILSSDQLKQLDEGGRGRGDRDRPRPDRDGDSKRQRKEQR